jgi:hypothetical protein
MILVVFVATFPITEILSPAGLGVPKKFALRTTPADRPPGGTATKSSVSALVLVTGLRLDRAMTCTVFDAVCPAPTAILVLFRLIFMMPPDVRARTFHRPPFRVQLEHVISTPLQLVIDVNKAVVVLGAVVVGPVTAGTGTLQVTGALGGTVTSVTFTETVSAEETLGTPQTTKSAIAKTLVFDSMAVLRFPTRSHSVISLIPTRR